MAFYQSFNIIRSEPDIPQLIKALQVIAPEMGVRHDLGTSIYILKKSTPWISLEMVNATNIITNASPLTERSTAQNEIDHLSIVLKAVVLTLIDEINILRQAAGLQPRTVQQAITAIRNKVGSL